MGKCALIGAECPRTNNPDAKLYCPAWSDGVVWTNVRTGEEKIVNCSFQALMPTLVEVVKASNRPAAAVESTRNEIVNGFAALIEMTQKVPALAGGNESLAISPQNED